MQKFIQVPLYDIQELEALITNAVLAAIDKKLEKLTPPKQEEYLTRKQTALRLGIALSTLHEYTQAGYIPAFRIGSRVRYKITDVEQSLTQIRAIKNN